MVGLRSVKKRRRSQRSARDTVELRVERIGAQGDGIASWAGEPVYLPFAVPGDLVRVELGVRRGAGREGKVVARLADGAGRVEPVCRHFGACGGCALQHLAPETYRSVKLDGLHLALRRAGLDPAIVAPLRSVAAERRRARLGLFRPRDPRAAAIVGFRERFRHDLVDVRECAVLEPALFVLIEPLRQAALTLLPPGGRAEAMLTRTDSGVDMLIEAADRPGLAALGGLADLAARHDLARIVWRAGREELPIVERRPVRVVFSGAAVPFPPGGFLQASAAAEAILVAEAVASIGDRRPALDLFAGLGAFALAMAAAGGPVHAVEGDAAAVAALAQADATVTVERRDLDRDPVPPTTLDRYAAAVFDPPRAGAAAQAAALAASTLDTVVAVSCNPATFARDAATLVAGGFRLERVVPVDQFVWTPHLELVAIFHR